MNSFGLSAMKERFIALGGDVSIEGKKDNGTTICVTVPLRGNQ